MYRSTYLTRRQFGGTLGLLCACARRAAGVTDIGSVLQDSLRRRGIPAAAAIAAMAATADRTFYAGAFGTRDATSGIKVTTKSIFGIASMTKAITTTAAMQLVEQGKLTLDEPVSKHLPELATINVLEGFDHTGKPILRRATIPVTLRMLLSHTSGFAYDTWNENMARLVKAVLPADEAAKPVYPSALWGRVPPSTICEPGTCWQYGTSADWTAHLVEVVAGETLDRYFQEHILDPLGMTDTGYVLSGAEYDRLVSICERQDDGSLKELSRNRPPPPRVHFGGAGLYSTVGDYTRFMQMFLRNGRGPGNVRILRQETVELMATNQIGKLSAGKMRNFTGKVWQDVVFHPGEIDGFGLGFLINKVDYPGGRSAGSLAWAGGWNTYFWIDRRRQICGVIMMQFQPFYDAGAVAVLSDFEHAVYRSAGK